MKLTNRRLWQSVKRWLPLVFILWGFVAFFSLGLQRYLSFQSLKAYQSLLIEWTNAHYWLASLTYIGIYTIAVAISVPGAVFLTLAGGFLFGPIWGSLFVVFSATLGASFLFFAVKTALGDSLAKRASSWVHRMRDGFNQNAFSYLLVLRLIPLFPFWVVNIVPALLGVQAKTFVLATFIGIIPGSVVYVFVGSGLSHVFATNQTPNLGIIFDPHVLLPLLGLATLSLLPVLYRILLRKRKGVKS
ncbi:mercuric reductase [Legionella lansingensis]|uniref:TVP38/TMEM64 family membrane protein n=1 Tax=Legionella lansingensis TaxID=45067 RepID=A0A0W0VXM8_9GAMM|nr:TVP38/TMEM64 family protein [Legionella lansingensis]KTD24753.1 hypothetical protein Llan_0315 [Legionella lansingensis]SNV48809.1 mercuric reductase [Legionella lansingensis]